MTEISDNQNQESIPFYPNHFRTELRVAWALLGIAVIIGIIALISPVGLEEPANPMVTPDHVKPEWYFLALYQLLKYVPKTIGVITPIIGIIFLMILPFYARKTDSIEGIKSRLVGSMIFMAVFISLTIWGWIS